MGGFSKVLRHDSIAILRERRKNEPIQSKNRWMDLINGYIIWKNGQIIIKNGCDYTFVIAQTAEHKAEIEKQLERYVH